MQNPIAPDHSCRSAIFSQKRHISEGKDRTETPFTRQAIAPDHPRGIAVYAFSIAPLADPRSPSITPVTTLFGIGHTDEESRAIREKALARILSTIKSAELEKELGKEIEAKKASIETGPAKVEQSDDFIEIDGVKMPKKHAAHLTGGLAGAQGANSATLP